MSRNPYAHPSGAEDDFPEAPRGVSGLAVTGFVFSLLFCIPLFGLIGAVFGVAGLVAIAGSQGRKGGRGLAFTALILGILGTFLWCAIGFGVVRAAGQFKAVVMVPAVRAAEGLQSGDAVPVKRLLAPPASAVDDAGLAAFEKSLKDKYGALQGLPKDLGWGMVLEAQAEVGKAMIPLPKMGAGVPVVFEKGRGTLILVFDSQDALIEAVAKGADGKIANVGVEGPDGSIMWLVDPKAGAAGPGGK